MSEADPEPQRTPRSETAPDLRPPRRVATDLPVRVSTIEPELDPLTGRPYFRASWERCENLSRGGAFIQTHELLDPGRRVLIELSLPDGERVEAIGRVAWTRRRLGETSEAPCCGVGVEFLGGASEQMGRLLDFVESDDDSGH